LGVEEQFYIAWPIALALLWRVTRNVVPAIALLTAASFALNVFMIRDDPVATFYLPVTRFWELGIGAILAAGEMNGGRVTERWQPIFSVAGFILLGGSIAFVGRVMFPGWLAALPTVGATLVIVAGPKAICNRLLSHPVAVAIGLISYPLYLWHWPLLTVLRALDLARPVPQLATIALSFALAFATYRLLELKVRKRPSPAYALRSVAALAAMVPIGMIFVIPDLRINAFPSDPFATWDWWNTPGCAEKYGLAREPLPFCVEANPDRLVSIMVIGDSNANHWAPGIIKSNPDAGILSIGGGACVYLDQVGSESPIDDLPHRQQCLFVITRAFEILRSTPSIETVILSSRIMQQIPGTTYDGSEEEPGRLLSSKVDIGKTNVEIYRSGLRRTLAEISNLNKHVYLIHQIPELRIHPQFCVQMRPIDLFISVPDCRVTRQDVDRKRYELARPPSDYERVLKRVGIQYCRISSMTAGMSL